MAYDGCVIARVGLVKSMVARFVGISEYPCPVSVGLVSLLVTEHILIVCPESVEMEAWGVEEDKFFVVTRQESIFGLLGKGRGRAGAFLIRHHGGFRCPSISSQLHLVYYHCATAIIAAYCYYYHLRGYCHFGGRCTTMFTSTPTSASAPHLP